MRHHPTTAAARGVVISLLAVLMSGIALWLWPADPLLRAEPAATAVTPSAYGYAPAIFAPGKGVPSGATATAPGPGTATPPAAATATPTPTVTSGTPAMPTAAPPTPTATRPVDPEPTPAVNALRIADTHILVTGADGRLTVRGEVVNDGAQAVRNLRVPVEFRNKNGRIVHTEMVLPMLSRLGPGERLCFTATLDAPKWWRSYTFGPIAYQIDSQPVMGLQVSETVGGVDEFLGWYAVTGRVTNTSSADYSLLRLAVTVYNVGGEVIGCDFTYSDNSDLAAGATDSFEFLLADREYPDAVGYHIVADGERR